MNTVISILPRAAAAILLAFVLAGTALAVERPPVRPEQQRAWLASRLVADMRATGVFSGDEIAETANLVSSLTDEQVALVVRLYCLMRQMAVQDARLLAVESSETLIRLRRQIRRVYWELVAISPGCRALCEIAYASIPGWCARYRYTVPFRYYRDGCHVGPIRSARYAGAFLVRVYGAYHDHDRRNDWWDGGRYFHENIVGNQKGAHGGNFSHATAAKKHRHPKTKHGPSSKTKHGKAAAARHGRHDKGSHVAARSAKHGGSSAKAGHGDTKSKSVPHSQPRRQQPKRGAGHAKPAAHRRSHPQHAAHGQGRHK
jgi:hypothetical protein